MPSRDFWSTSGEMRRIVPVTASAAAGRDDLHRHAGLKTRQGCLNHCCSEFQFTADRNSEQRIAACRNDAAERRVARKDEAIGRSLHFGLLDLQQNVLLLRVDDGKLRLGSRDRLVCGKQLCLGAVITVDGVVELHLRGHALELQSLRPIERLLRLAHADFGIADLGAHLGDSRLGLGAARIDLGKLRVEGRPVENGQNVALLDRVAFIGVELKHNHAVEVCAGRRFFTGND